MIRANDDVLDETHEINVTPFIDVVLVLLIIFMVAAPLATVDVPVDLPSATATPQSRPDKPVYLTLTAEHRVLLDQTPVASGDLEAALDQATGSDKATRIFLRADRTVEYGELMALMNSLRAASYLKVALVALDSGDAK